MKRAAAAAALALAVSACAANPRPLAPAGKGIAPRVGTVEEGTASWYGPGYDGGRTACGERFDQDALTAAHPRWACGTRVRVTFLATDRSVVVRINDHFGAHKGRVIDVSREAARRIGLIGPGTGRVRLEVVE